MRAWMPLQAGIKLTKRFHFFIRKDAMRMKHRVLSGNRMPFGKNHLAALGRMKIHIRFVNGRQHINDGKRAAGMARVGGMNHIHDGSTIAVRQGLYPGWVAHIVFLQSRVYHENSFIVSVFRNYFSMEGDARQAGWTKSETLEHR